MLCSSLCILLQQWLMFLINIHDLHDKTEREQSLNSHYKLVDILLKVTGPPGHRATGHRRGWNSSRCSWWSVWRWRSVFVQERQWEWGCCFLCDLATTFKITCRSHDFVYFSPLEPEEKEDESRCFDMTVSSFNICGAAIKKGSKKNNMRKCPTLTQETTIVVA